MGPDFKSSESALQRCLPHPPHFRFFFILRSFLNTPKESSSHSSGPVPIILPVLIMAHESEGFRLCNVYGAVEEVNSLTYSIPCLSVSSDPIFSLSLSILSGFLVSVKKENQLALTSFDTFPSLSCILIPSHFLFCP